MKSRTYEVRFSLTNPSGYAKKWFIVLGDGFTVNTVGFKTKKAAVAVVEEAGWTVVDEFKVS